MLRHYWTQALRNFNRHRVTTAVNLAGLSLALVCFVSTYVLLQSMTHTDLHFAKAERTLVITQELWNRDELMVPGFPQAAPPTAKYLKADFPQLETVARSLSMGSLAVANGDRKVDLLVAAVDPDFLKIFDFTFRAGSPATALASAHEVLITEPAAKRLFGTTEVLGRRVLLQGKVNATISAVIAPVPQPSHMGDGPRALMRFEILVPVDFLKTLPTSAGIGMPVDPDGEQWGMDIFNTYVVLPADGSFTADEFRAGLPGFAARRADPVTRNFQMTSVFGAVPLQAVVLAGLDALMSGRIGSLTVSVFLLDVLILIIACVNYANLAVATATTRAKEVGMRKVLGATRLQLTGQYLFEAALLGTVALIMVIAGTALAIPPINRALGLFLEMPPVSELGLWASVVGILCGIGLIGGAYPALVLSRIAPVEALRAGSVRSGPRFVPTVLVGIQFAAASFLLIAALLMANHNRSIERNALRPDRDPIVVVGNDMRSLGVEFDTLRNELLRNPAIKSVVRVGTVPWSSGGWHYPIQRTPDASAAQAMTLANQVGYGFFESVGIALLAGRSFDEQHDDLFFNPEDARNPASRVPNVVIDRALARQLGFPDPADAVNQVLYDPPSDAPPVRAGIRVIGVVENGYPRLIGPNTESNLYMLAVTFANVPLVRLERTQVAAGLAHLDAVWQRLAPNAPLRRQFMDELFEVAYRNFSMLSRVVGALAGFAFAIAIMGLFGMAIHVTTRRRREIGIRKTLGASASRVVLMLLRDFARPIAAANLVAWPLAFFAGRLYLSLFTERSSMSPWPFVLGLAITLAIAWIAVGGQALLAARLKPAWVLRFE
jgi:putative ABC transport system permease protein